MSIQRSKNVAPESGPRAAKSTAIVARMSHWKWRETKRQPSRGHQISCCLVYLHFMCDILATITVWNTQWCKFLSQEVRENRAFLLRRRASFPLSVCATFRREFQIITQNYTPLSTDRPPGNTRNTPKMKPSWKSGFVGDLERTGYAEGNCRRLSSSVQWWGCPTVEKTSFKREEAAD